MITRTTNIITCQLCQSELTTFQFPSHLQKYHQLTTDDYVDQFGEFRINVLKKLPPTEKCLICDDNILYSRNGLTIHLKNQHDIIKLKYVKKYILLDTIPLCLCGCGNEVDIKTYKPYITNKFINGHQNRGTFNSRYNKEYSEHTRNAMRIAAKQRIEKYKQNNDILPMHTSEAIQKRATTWRDNFVSRIELEYDVSILNQYHEETKHFYKVQCNICHHKFEQFHQSYFRCPSCNEKYNSLLEKEILIELQNSLPDEHIINNSRHILPSGKELDIYFPDHKLAIEMNGLYWHSELQGKDKTYHLEKTIECEKMGIQLFHIFEDEWIHKKIMILNKIYQKLNKFSGARIFARKCKIQEVSAKETVVFLNENHLQGTDNSKIRYGLYYNDELVAVMTFSYINASRGIITNNNRSTFELSRFAVQQGKLVIGAASKLLSHFIKHHSPTKIISYANRRWSVQTDNVYTKIGFHLATITKPSYWYFKNNKKRYHRFNFTKKKTIHMGGDIELTEWENMKLFGYDRIWDCGNLKYEWTA